MKPKNRYGNVFLLNTIFNSIAKPTAGKAPDTILKLVVTHSGNSDKTEETASAPDVYKRQGICHTIICEWQTKKDVDTVNQLSIFINTHPRLSLHHRMKRKEADIWQR